MSINRAKKTISPRNIFCYLFRFASRSTSAKPDREYNRIPKASSPPPSIISSPLSSRFIISRHTGHTRRISALESSFLFLPLKQNTDEPSNLKGIVSLYSKRYSPSQKKTSLACFDFAPMIFILTHAFPFDITVSFEEPKDISYPCSAHILVSFRFIICRLQ